MIINVYYGGHSDITDHMIHMEDTYLLEKHLYLLQELEIKIVSNLPSPTAEAAFTHHSVKYNFSFRSNDQSSKFLLSKLTLL